MLKEVKFTHQDYDAGIALVLEREGSGNRLMPLVHVPGSREPARSAIGNLSAPSTVLSGLYFYCSCWDEAHTAADSGETAENYYWHALVHRQEPDASNAAYWFRQTGGHPIFPRLYQAAAALGYVAGSAWDPIAFIAFCGSARAGSAQEQLAMQVQLAEWQLLFDYCARRPAG